MDVKKDVKVTDEGGYLTSTVRSEREHQDRERANLEQSFRQQDWVSALVSRH